MKLSYRIPILVRKAWFVEWIFHKHFTGAAPVSFNEVEKLTEEKYTIRKYKRILFYVVICVLLAAFLLGQYIYPSEREPVTEESITYTGTFYRMLGESKLRQLFVSNASILSNMCFFVVMLCPVPIMFYIDSVQQER